MRESLKGKHIVLGVTGSIAAVETVRLAHALQRKGAVVTAVMSNAATGIIHPDALTYATGNNTIVDITGRVAHIMYCGDGGLADLFLIAPCTANTLCKVAAGIDDTPVTTFATTAIGRDMPIIIVPAMHHSMFRHPAVRDSLTRLESWGVMVVPPRIEEGKAKIAEIDEIVLFCERELLGKPLAGKKVLITSGPCQEEIDDVRIMTTRSSGRMGQELALQAFRLGAEVIIVHHAYLSCMRNIVVTSAADMRAEVIRICTQEKPDLYISAAAISDFAPKKFEGKLRSGGVRKITLLPLPKLLDEVINEYGIPCIAFKLGKDAEEPARELLVKGAVIVVINGPETMGSAEGEILILNQHSRVNLSGTKEDLAVALWDRILGDSGAFGW
ncbi:MAG: bifunctional phosphopantothenoylcysteine decarboxylase/phosphopantothenate--cysteine ligase CoaBC [Methanoregulaceae archaeon]|nr:bifunctional phosphopantothenoylcysteine decarboxylase/phosphopantothenate--cysteine ligase CoaBC [Methanoregulaceae archaeon]